MRVLILHDALSETPTLDDEDNRRQVEAVSEALRTLGHEPRGLACSLDLATLKEQITELAPDLVFNLVETVDGSGRLIHIAPALLERMGITFTGSGADAIFMTSNKLLTKKTLAAAKVDVPPWTTPERLADGAPFPRAKMIVKSVWEHASIGLDEASILSSPDRATLAAELARRAPRLGGSCFAEAFIDGRELNVSVLETPEGPRVLPAAEIVFRDFGPERPRIVGYRAKWETESFEYENTQRVFLGDAEEDRELLTKVETISLRCFELLGLRGYGRVDFRVDHRGRPHVLEINTNPCISPDAGFPAAAARAGIGYDRLVEMILGAASSRPPRRGEPSHLRDQLSPRDRRSLEGAVRSTGFFNQAEVEIALEIIDEHLARGPSSGYSFLLDGPVGAVTGYSCYGPVPGTRSSFDLYWIVVKRDCWGRGGGRRLMAETERRVRAAGGERLYAETSGRPDYEPTRAFYAAMGFDRAAVFPDFYAPGDDKVVYVKPLGAS